MTTKLDPLFLQINNTSDCISINFDETAQDHYQLTAILFQSFDSKVDEDGSESEFIIQTSSINEITVNEMVTNLPVPLKGTIDTVISTFNRIKDANLSKKIQISLNEKRLHVKI